MKNKKHHIFMQTAILFADESKCVSKHVGAVVVRDGRIISTGYNGSPPDLPNCCEVFDPENFDREEHHVWSKDNEIHAEMNATGFSAKHNVEMDGCDLYVTMSPCNDCLKNLTATGIKNIYYLYLYDKVTLNPALLKKINVQEVPGAKELKKFVEILGYKKLY
jgi:dCMP deaminase